jgi:hypothetical protein
MTRGEGSALYHTGMIMLKMEESEDRNFAFATKQ